jgi:UDP-N-acetylmuramate-alanine ligase
MKVHLVGIGGAGMSALARLYLALGHTVSGSDASDSPALRDLAVLGATVHVGHDGAYVQGTDLVVTTSAAPAQTPELVAARAQGIRLLKHAQALGELFNAQRGIAVAGTHGKTTTTAMIAFVLQRCGLAPKFQVGGELVDLGTSAGWGEGQWMVIEADEFDRRFLEYRPEIAVVTNVEPDHFEYFGSVAEMEGAFRDYLRNVLPGGAVVACAQEPRLATLLEEVNGRRIVRYGAPAAGSQPGPEWDWWASDVVLEPGGSRWTANRRAGQGAGGGAGAAPPETGPRLSEWCAADPAEEPSQRAGREGRRRRRRVRAASRSRWAWASLSHPGRVGSMPQKGTSRPSAPLQPKVRGG